MKHNFITPLIINYNRWMNAWLNVSILEKITLPMLQDSLIWFKWTWLLFLKYIFIFVTTLALASRPRQGLAKVWAKNEAWESHFMLLRKSDNVREWTLALPSELPLWELKFQWTFESLKSNFKGQISLDQKVIYIIEKLLEHRYLKWVRMTRLNTWNTSYGQKKGRESNWQFDSWPLKVGNRPNFLVFKWCATYRWKDLDKGYNFVLNLTSIRGMHTKLWAPKVARVSTLGISRPVLESLGTKWHLGDGPVAKHKIYYKGESCGFPQVRAVMNFMNPCLPMVHPCTKKAPATH
jgi:hypothetical protein